MLDTMPPKKTDSDAKSPVVRVPKDMLDRLAELGSDGEVKAVILTGEGRAFS